jgi:hypothetical protein
VFFNKIRWDEQARGTPATFPGYRTPPGGRPNERRPVQLFHPLLNRETANLGQPKAEEEEEDVVGPSMSDAA